MLTSIETKSETLEACKLLLKDGQLESLKLSDKSSLIVKE